MSATITDTDIRYHVVQMTPDGDYDVDAIVEHIIREHGRIDIGGLDTADGDAELADQIWTIVWEHELHPEDATVEEIEAGLRERGVTDAEVTLDAADTMWVFRGTASVTLGGEIGGWTYTYRTPRGDDPDDVYEATDGIEGTGPGALARVLDMIAFQLATPAAR